MRDDARRRELAAFLRARRANIKPTDVGLPEGIKRRRTPGLRREELAQLSGVGLTWYTWLEQARDIPASPQVVQALASALRLDDDERRHLFTLAGLPVRLPAAEPGQAPPTVQRMLDSLMPNPAYVIDQRFDIVAWNAAQAGLWLDPGRVPPADRNLVWLMFHDPAVRTLLEDWSGTARTVVAQFRAAAGQFPDDPRFEELSARLSEHSAEFAQWWNAYSVAEFDVSVNRLKHPVCGPLDLDLFHLRVIEYPNLTIVLQTPVGDEDARQVRQLAALAGAAASTSAS
jgi:transcriptional regulator with XRE-family HTH domain